MPNDITNDEFSGVPGSQIARDVEQSQSESKPTDLNPVNFRAAQCSREKVDKNRQLKKQPSAEDKAAFEIIDSFMIKTQTVRTPDRSGVRS